MVRSFLLLVSSLLFFSRRVCRTLSVFPGTPISGCVCLHVFDSIYLVGLFVAVCVRSANRSALPSLCYVSVRVRSVGKTEH